MKRRYTKELFAERMHVIKELMPHACIATDVIAGFPGETEEEFNEEMDFISGSAISYMHVFTYSKRNNTKASELGDEVHGTIKKERSRLLHELSETKKNYFYLQNKGRECNALIESDRHQGFLYGFTDNYIKVRVPFQQEIINSIIRVKLLEPSDDGSFEVAMRNGL
jgi:threonylcarbamoyladenosine tRNA methylthiotransferase MtaB